VGRFLQQRAQRAAGDSAELLHSLSPRSARVLDPDGTAREVPAESLVPGALLEVRAGETLAADGLVTEGRSELDLSLLTGESRLAPARPGDRVFAGTVNRAGLLRVEVERSGEVTRLAQLVREVERGARRRAPVVALADRLAGGFVAVVLALAAVTFAIWLHRGAAFATDQAIALLIVTCPCALALATPLAVTVAIGRAARAGILVKHGAALEALARPSRLVLDKTGTLTEGRAVLVRWRGPEDLRPLVLALERHVTHPLAIALRQAWPAIETPPARDVTVTIGGGVEGEVSGRRLVVGSPAFVAERVGAGDDVASAGGAPASAAAGLDRDGGERPAPEPLGRPGETPVLVAVDGRIEARAWFADAIRADAPEALARLRARGWRTRLLSGDDPVVVAEVGTRLGFAGDERRGGASPEDKLAEIEKLAAHGPVVMVGDGVNDAAAIARATVGVGVHGGAEASLAAADVFLARPGLAGLVALTEGAARTLRVIRRNLAFSIAYNLLGAGLAIAGLVNPLVAAILMPASSLTVVIASWRSRTFDGAPSAAATARAPGAVVPEPLEPALGAAGSRP
jgi:Cu2+-exporting ATPase